VRIVEASAPAASAVPGPTAAGEPDDGQGTLL
jgi:hypothetical protein